MNYKKIYEDFIASRRLTEKSIVGYSESHHILPKALGGGNDEDNLIRLIPEDHIHAHILLAKIHGGKMWGAASLMLKTTIGRSRSIKRIPSKDEIKAVAFARKMHSKYCIGVNANRYGIKHTEETKAKMSVGHQRRRQFVPAWNQDEKNKASFSGDNHWTRKEKNKGRLAAALPKFKANLRIASEKNKGLGNPMMREDVAKKVSIAISDQYKNGFGTGSLDAIRKRRESHQTIEYREKARCMFVSRREKMGGILGDNPNSRKVKCVETGIIFTSVKEAMIFCGGDVTKACRTGGSAGGYKWIRFGHHSTDGRATKNGQ